MVANASKSDEAVLAGADPDSDRMYQLVVGGWASQTVGALARFGIADLLQDGARSPEEVASATGAHGDAMYRLLRAGVSLGVLARAPDGRFALTSLGRTLTAGAAGSMLNLAKALTSPGHWLPWAWLDDAIRSGQPQATRALGCQYFDHLSRHPAEGADFMRAMDDLAKLVAGEVVRLLDVAGAKEVADVGGASGTLVGALLDHHPQLRGSIVELPSVVPMAREAIARRGLASRCNVIAQDFFDAIPEADIYLLKLIIHDWDDERAVRILANCARSLRANGRVVLVESVLPDDDRLPMPLVDINMLVLLGGRERTVGEYSALFDAAGLRLERVVETRSYAQMIEARRA
jgi:SAM-dependent methyltransferase